MNLKLVSALLIAVSACVASAQVAVKAGVLHTAASDAIENGVVVIGADGMIEAVGPASEVAVPQGYEVIECAVATPGLVDVRTTAGLTGIFNVAHDQDVIETSSAMQPQLRALDAYNPRDRLVDYIRGFGVTTIHTGHAPGELITGQTIIVKTRGETVEDALLQQDVALTATLSPMAQRSGGPGTRGKMYAMLREKLIDAQEYMRKLDGAAEPAAEPADDADGEGDEASRGPARNLGLEPLVRALRGEMPIIITANRSQDIASAMRLAEEFGFELWLDMAAESYVLADEIAERDIPVLLHPIMFRMTGETSNMSYDTPGVLDEAGVRFAIQSGFEAYVPKVRVVLFEAGAMAGYGGHGPERALRAVTIDAARILGIDAAVGSLEVGKHGDIAMYSGDPFEYTTHCLGVLIQGERFGGEKQFEVGYP